MSTGQNYGANGFRPNPIEPVDGSNPSTAPTAAQPLLQPDHRLFIHGLTELAGLPVEQLIPAINDRLSHTPLPYVNILTGTALLRAVCSLSGGDLLAHYVLLLRDQQIVGVRLIPAIVEFSADDRPSLITYHDEETRPLLRALVECEADQVLLATARNDGAYCFETMAYAEINRLREALELFNVELLDYLLFYPDLNVSWAYAEHGEAGLDEGVRILDLEYCGIAGEDDDALPLTASVNQPTTLTLN